MSAIRNNDVDFVKTVFARLTPKAKVTVSYDLSVSLQANIAVQNFDNDGKPYPVGNMDLRLFLERYERHGIDHGDEQTRDELISMGVIGVHPPVSTGAGIPQADPFAQPEGLSTSDRIPTGQKPR